MRAEKYYFTFCDDFNKEYRVSILDRDFSEPFKVINSISDTLPLGSIINGLNVTADDNNTGHGVQQVITNDNAAVRSYTVKLRFKGNREDITGVRLSFQNSYPRASFIINSVTNRIDLTTQNDFTVINEVVRDDGDGYTYFEATINTSVIQDFVLAVNMLKDGISIFEDDTASFEINQLELIDLSSGIVPEPIELQSGVNPYSVAYDAESDLKYTAIRPSLATLNLIFGTGDGVDFEEFWTSDEKRFKIEVKNANGVLDWAGFVIPSGFSYELKGGVYFASLEASDGLGLLESYRFIDDNLAPYGNQNLTYNNGFEFPFSLIITEILKKLDLDLDLWACVSAYERSMVKVGDVREADPLSASFVNVKTYIKHNEDENIPYWFSSNDVWNCQEVLENILNIFGAKIYQQNGSFRIKSIDIDALDVQQKSLLFWRKYNSVGTYLGNYEPIELGVNIPCVSDDGVMLEDNHTLSMIEAFKSFRMNYEYTFLRDGDDPLSIVKNGNFQEFNSSSKLAAPNGWERWSHSNKWKIRIKKVDSGLVEFPTALEVGSVQVEPDYFRRTDPNAAIWTSLRNNQINNAITVLRGDVITLNTWVKTVFLDRYSETRGNKIAPIFRMFVSSDVDGVERAYYLKNDNAAPEGFSWQSIRDLGGFRLDGALFFYLNNEHLDLPDNYDLTTHEWHNFNIKLPKMPIGGNIQFHIHGLGGSSSYSQDSFPPFTTWHTGRDRYDAYKYYKVYRFDRLLPQASSYIPKMQITGLDLGIIPEESELPEQSDYIFSNNNRNFTFQTEPITVYNGDTQDAKHVSNIIVPSNTNGRNFWSDINNTFKYSSIGLLTVKQIMKQYFLPSRMLEGAIRKNGAKIGDVFTFDAVPNISFILHRGVFNYQKQYIEDATFLQVSNLPLPNGGLENGNTLDPRWIDTSNFYCEKTTVDGASVNTGFVFVEQIDVNPNSETYEETREVRSDNVDSVACPINGVDKYFWGHSPNEFITQQELESNNITEIIDENTVAVNFSNKESNFLFFVYLKSLNDVKRITTLTSPNNVLIDWGYLDDITINGHIYRLMKTDYFMTEFTDFNHNFIF